MGEDMTLSHFAVDAWKYVFNTPLESGLRSTVLLVAAYPARCDLYRLTQYEYLLVHSGDVANGPPSLHPASPHRAGELLVRRGVVQRGVQFMLSRSVICRQVDGQGLSYYAGEWAVPFLDALQADYTHLMRQRANWVVKTFGDISADDLSQFMRANWANWGSEFSQEFFLAGQR
jgi:hypothetical protein